MNQISVDRFKSILCTRDGEVHLHKVSPRGGFRIIVKYRDWQNIPVALLLINQGAQLYVTYPRELGNKALKRGFFPRTGKFKRFKNKDMHGDPCV